MLVLAATSVVVHDRQNLGAVLNHVASLWGFSVRLERQNADGSISLISEKQVEWHWRV